MLDKHDGSEHEEHEEHNFESLFNVGYVLEKFSTVMRWNI